MERNNFIITLLLYPLLLYIKVNICYTIIIIIIITRFNYHFSP